MGVVELQRGDDSRVSGGISIDSAAVIATSLGSTAPTLGFAVFEGTLHQRNRVIYKHPILILIPRHFTARHTVAPAKPDVFERPALHHVIQRDVPLPLARIVAAGGEDVVTLQVHHRGFQPRYAE